MSSSDLSFFTCEELIQELMHRTTFYGCVVHAAEPHRRDNWSERMFRVHFNQDLDLERTSRLLEAVAEKLMHA